MAIRGNRRVSFADEKSLGEEVFELRRENELLKEKLEEMEGFYDKAEKCFSHYKESALKVEEMGKLISDYQLLADKNAAEISQLQKEVSGYSQENQKLRSEISDLQLKKQLLENEVERLNNLLYSRSEEKKTEEKKQNFIQNNLKLNKNLRSPSAKLEKINSFEVQAEFKGLKDSRTKLSDRQKEKMKTLASKNVSCKSSSIHFDFVSPPTSPKLPDLNTVSPPSALKKPHQTSNIEELKRLIRQAKENHVRLKSTF